MYETLLIDGVDVGSLGCVQNIDGLYISPATRGDNVTIPGADGEVYVDKPFAAGTATMQLLLSGSTQTQFNDAYRQLKLIAKPGRLVTLTRRLSFSTGYEEHVAMGEYVSGLEPQLTLARFGKIALTMKVNSGIWYSPGVFGVVAPGSVYIAGEARTRRITMTMGPGTVTNSTTGASVTYYGSGTATVDVENMSANAGGVDVSNDLAWVGLFPMELNPGYNNISGSASISYRAAYL